MKSAILRLLAISLGVLLFCAICLLFLNFMGQQQRFSPFDHKLLNENPSYLFVEEELKPEDSSLNFSQIIPYLNVTSFNEDWVLKSQDKENPIFLKDYIVTNSPEKLALFVNSRINLGALVKILLDAGLNENVVIFANEQKIIIELKKMAPRWLYAANPSQKMRIKIMDSIWLAPLGNYDFDFYVFDPASELELTSSLLKELKRRHKKILSKIAPESLSESPRYDGYLLIH